MRGFSVQDAMRAHLWGNAHRRVWLEYPKRMLMARARAYALRDGFADCLMGLSIRRSKTCRPQHRRGPTPPFSTMPPPYRHNESPARRPPPANSDMRGTTAEMPEAPSRSPLWETASYELKIPKNARARAAWRKLYDDLLRLIGEAASEAELERLQRDNKRTIPEIGSAVPHGREVLDQAFASRLKAIPGE